MIKIFNSCTWGMKNFNVTKFLWQPFIIDFVDHWISSYCACSWWPTTLIFSIINFAICNFVMCIIGQFISFVSVILFVCFNNNILLWRRFARSVMKILFVFLFPDSFQLLVNVSIHSVYKIGIWLIWYVCKHSNLPILRYIVILISVRIIFDEIFYYFIFRFNFSFQKMNLFFKICYYCFIYECLVFILAV